MLKKINPLLASMAREHFPDAERKLFGPGFEQRLKTRSETADTIEKAAKVSTPGQGKPFFRGIAFRGRQSTCGGQPFQVKYNINYIKDTRRDLKSSHLILVPFPWIVYLLFSSRSLTKKTPSDPEPVV